MVPPRVVPVTLESVVLQVPVPFLPHGGRRGLDSTYHLRPVLVFVEEHLTSCLGRSSGPGPGPQLLSSRPPDSPLVYRSPTLPPQRVSPSSVEGKTSYVTCTPLRRYLIWCLPVDVDTPRMSFVGLPGPRARVCVVVSPEYRESCVTRYPE